MVPASSSRAADAAPVGLAESDVSATAVEHPEGPADGQEHSTARFGLVGSLAIHAGITLIGIVGVVLALRLGVGSPAKPGPGLWPLLAAALTTTAGLVTIMETVAGARVMSLRGSAKPAVGVALMVAFVLLFSAATAVVAMAVFFVLWTRLLGGLAWRAVALWTLLGTAALYLLFGVVLATPFPTPLIAIP